MLSNTLNDIAVVWHLVNCIANWPQNARLHGRSRPCDTPSPTLTSHNLTLMWQVVTLWLWVCLQCRKTGSSNLRPCSGDMCKDVYLGFPWAIGVCWASSKKLFFVFRTWGTKYCFQVNTGLEPCGRRRNIQHQRRRMRRGAVPSEPDNWFGNIARILRRMTHLVQHFSLHFWLCRPYWI